MRHTTLIGFIAAFIFSSTLVFAGEPVKLPAPRMEGGKPLLQALKERKTGRAFAATPLPDQLLSDLLWAADGVNRPDGHRTAPSAMNMQEIEIYVATADGLYLYNAKENSLLQVVAGDIRAATGKQDFVKGAPVNLVFVAANERMGANPERNMRWAYADAGIIAENVYLFCASEGLATVVRGSFDEKELAAAMKLNPMDFIILTQTVGYPQ